jgi:hypothetical protein
LLKAATLVRSLVDMIALQLALPDFYTARREVGPYSAFYAYGVVEDVGFQFGFTKNGHPDWEAMNNALGTSKEKWSQLTRAGTIARHLNNKALGELEVLDRSELLGLAREALEISLEKIGVRHS